LAKVTFPELSCVIVVRADIFDGASIPSKSTSLFSSEQPKNRLLKKCLVLILTFSYINNIS
jgi:hypothetical protein